MKAIGFLNSVTSWGGGEKWYYEAATYFAERDYEVHFFLARNGSLHERLKNVKGIQVYFVHIDGLSFLNPIKVGRLQQQFSKSKVEVLIINLSNDLKIGGRAATAAGIRKIIYRRAVPLPVKSTGLNRYIFQHWLSGVLANSQATKKAVLKEDARLISPEKIRVIYNPLHSQKFLDMPFSKVYSKECGELVIGSAGRLEKEKNHAFLILLSAELTRRGVKHKVLIAGKGSLQNGLLELARQKNVSEQILFLGFLPNVKDLLCSCDVFVFPSFWEGFGFAVAEASLIGLPVIAFNTTSMPEVIDDGKTGYLVDVNAVEQAAHKLQVLAGDDQLRRRMGKQGSLFVQEKFDYEKVMSELEEYLFG